jgi:hypothetical protein
MVALILALYIIRTTCSGESLTELLHFSTPICIESNGINMVESE